MTKINFATPFTRKPTGGLRVVNELCEQLSKSYETGVWPDYQTRIASGSHVENRRATLSENAHWILTECRVPYINKSHEIRGRYSVFVQNPYILFTLKRFNHSKVIENLRNAKYIFCISEDAELIIKTFLPEGKTIRLRWSLDANIIGQMKEIEGIINANQRVITYMPRKCLQIHKLLETKSAIHGYELRPIKNLPYSQLLQELRHSSIFIALNEFEGFAAPPIEAYALGNIIVGYSGNGNEKLFRYKNFHQVEQNGYLKLITQLENVIEEKEAFEFEQYDSLLSKFSKEAVKDYNLKNFAELDLSDGCVLSKYFSYPKTRIGSVIDSFQTKLYNV